MTRALFVCVLAFGACGRTELIDLPVDAGSADAGRPDAGADAGTPDAGCVPPSPATFPATLRMTADDQYRLWVNGGLIDATPRRWSEPQRYTVQLFSDPRAVNTIAIEGRNRFNQDGFDRGVVAELTWNVGAAQFRVLTDRAWRASKTLPVDWHARAFDDTSWAFATEIATHGSPPWGNVLGMSSATWVWTYSPSAPGNAKPADETIALRRAFSVSPSGAPIAPAPQCP